VPGWHARRQNNGPRRRSIREDDVSDRTDRADRKDRANRGRTNRIATLLCSLAFALAALACAPEVGSDAWCEKMKEKSKGDWSANEAADFAKHCIFP
jgi:hypothetical protein